MAPISDGNVERFSGFADLYDAHRPQPPLSLGPLLARYCGVSHPDVVDLGSGTGLSSRWAATWARSVVGVEPNTDMMAHAIAQSVEHVTYRSGSSDNTGLPTESADVVLAVQAMHWMEPSATHREVARVLRPGGIFAVIDADWPPVTGLSAAERAWMETEERIDALPTGPTDVHKWAKSEHVARMHESGEYSFVRELVFHEQSAGGADRFVALLRSQGGYQTVHKRGVLDAEIGIDAFEATVHAAFAANPTATVSFNWRVRLAATT
jgi:SAM-dependent methyltransferase